MQLLPWQSYIPNTSQKISLSAKMYRLKYSKKNGLPNNTNNTETFIPAGTE
jgi:hypothetical protein